MKDKKFVVMCVLGVVWLLIFVATCFGEKIHPRVEQLVTFLCVGWFAYWTLSTLFGKDKTKPTETQNTNANSTKTTDTTDSETNS